MYGNVLSQLAWVLFHASRQPNSLQLWLVDFKQTNRFTSQFFVYLKLQVDISRNLYNIVAANALKQGWHEGDCQFQSLVVLYCIVSSFISKTWLTKCSHLQDKRTKLKQKYYLLQIRQAANVWKAYIRNCESCVYNLSHFLKLVSCACIGLVVVGYCYVGLCPFLVVTTNKGVRRGMQERARAFPLQDLGIFH